MATNPTAFVQSESARLKSENEQLRGELRNLREFVAALNDLAAQAAKLKGDSELMPLLNIILNKALNLLNAPDGSLALLDESTHELVFVLVVGQLASDLTGYHLPADEGIAGWVIQNGEPELVRDVRRDTRFFGDVDAAFKFRTQSILAAPLIGDGRVLGVIEALNQPGDSPFSESDMDLLQLLCRFAGEALAAIERRPTVE
jgi:GAF domain-containing protein